MGAGLLGLAPVAFVSQRAAAAPGDITTFAGALGRGPATSVSQEAVAIAGGGGLLYVADEMWNVVRVVDRATGDEEVVAGIGDQGFSGDGGPATAAKLNYPTGLAVSPQGDLYLADTNNHRVRKIDHSGRITTVVGTGGTGAPLGDGGPATAAHIESPAALALDALGQLYIAETGGQRVRKVDLAGRISTVAGNGTRGYSGDGGPAVAAGLDVPQALAVDSLGRVYVGDTTARVRRVDGRGIINTVVGSGTSAFSGDGGQAAEASIESCQALAIDHDGNLYVGGLKRLRKVDASGVISTVAGRGSNYGSDGDGGPAVQAGLLGVMSISLESSGSVLFAEGPNGGSRVRQIDTSGLITTVAGVTNGTLVGEGTAARDAQIWRTSAMVSDARGNLLIGQGGLVRKIDASGILTTVAGNPFGGGESSADPPTTIMGVSGLAVDTDGTIYVSDAWRVMRIEPSGALVRLAGKVGVNGYGGDGGPGVEATLNYPAGLALDGRGNLYVGDSGNHRVRRIDPSGVITTVAGSGTYGTGGDGGPATAAQLAYPGSVAVGRSGDLYLADSSNWRVRKVDSLGTITTLALPPNIPGAMSGGVVLDGADVPYTTTGDPAAPRVVRLTPSGPVPVAGNGTRGSGGDGGPATAAPLDPESMAFDPAGNLYISDIMTRRIRKVEAAGAPAPEVHAAGYNAMGQLGTGTAVDRRVPAAVESAAKGSAVAGGGYHSVALGSDGLVRTWGWNLFGQLGDGTVTTGSLPRVVPGLGGVKAVAAGTFHSLAVRNDGTVWSWGWNGLGQLGDGTTLERHAPVKVVGLDHVVAVAAGVYHSLAVRDDGTVWAWGFNGFGQLGDATTTDRHAPVQVRGLTGVTMVSGGALHSLALLGDGTVRAWGWNGVGQLGTGALTDSNVPVAVAWLGGVRALSVGGYFHTLALRNDGTVSTWGWNLFGQLGSGTTATSASPVRVANLDGIVAVGAGAYHSLATRVDGTVRGWGWNLYGQLGDGSLAERHLPVRTGLNTVSATAGGVAHTLGDRT